MTMTDVSLLDEPALLAWLSEHIPGFAGPLTIRQFVGGQSNPTFALETPERRLVLRKKPTGPLLPSAHQIEREYRVLRALESTGVPVPKALVLCEETAIVGAPFYVMEFLDGRIFRDPALPNCSAGERAAIYDSAAHTLARLHRVDFRAVDLAGFGRTDSYLARQVARWTTQYEASQTQHIPSMDALISWLPAHLPVDDEVTIAHGDYRIGNLMFHPTEPRAIGILDWELSTLGHPLLDVAYAVLMHYLPEPVMRGMGGSVTLSNAAGVPSVTEFVSSYAAYAQRPKPPDLHFFLALAFFRSASIMQGIAKRIVLGNAAGADAEQRAAVTPLLADLGWRIANGSLDVNRG